MLLHRIQGSRDENFVIVYMFDDCWARNEINLKKMNVKFRDIFYM